MQKPVILLPKPFKVKIKNNSIIEKLQVSEAIREYFGVSMSPSNNPSKQYEHVFVDRKIKSEIIVSSDLSL